LGKLPPGKIKEMNIVELNRLKHAVGLK